MATPITTTGRPVSRPNTPSTPANQSGPGLPPSPGNSSLPQTPGGAQNHQTAVANSSSPPTTSTHTQPPSLPATRPPPPPASISSQRGISTLFTKLRRAVPCFSAGTWIGLVFAILFGVVTWRASQYQSMVAFHDACLNRRDHNLTVSLDCTKILESSPKAPSTFFKRAIGSADYGKVLESSTKVPSTLSKKPIELTDSIAQDVPGTLHWATATLSLIMAMLSLAFTLKAYAELRRMPFISTTKVAYQV